MVEKLPEYTNDLQEVFRKTDSLKVRTPFCAFIVPFLFYAQRTLALSKSSEFTKRMQTLMTEQRFVVYDDPNTTAVFGRVRRSVSPHFLHFFFFLSLFLILPITLCSCSLKPLLTCFYDFRARVA